MRATRPLLLLAAVIGLAVGTTGCGGSSSSKSTTETASELEAWTGGLCTAVAKFKTSVAATRATLHARDLSRPALQVAVQDLSAAARQLGHDLQELGRPPLSQSEEAGKILADLRAGLGKQGDKIRAVVTNASSTGDVRQAASNITDALTAATDEASHAAGELRNLDSNGDVERAFDNAESC